MGASVASIERTIDRTASALFAAACAYAAHAWLAVHSVEPMLVAETSAASVLAYLGAAFALGAVKAQDVRLRVPVFDVREIASVELPELLLTERAEMPAATAMRADEPLLLDDALAAPGPHLRVVRLFDPSAMPPVERIERARTAHVARSADQQSDTVRLLHDALAELRRSLR